MLDMIFSSVLLPEPLRPTIPRNSPWWTSNETSRSARCSRYSIRRSGCVARSLNESTRWVGMRNVFSTPRTSMTTGSVSSSAQQYHARAMAFPDLTALPRVRGLEGGTGAAAPGPAADAESLRLAYLGLLKLALCDLAGTSTASVSRLLDGSVASRELSGEDRRCARPGLDWPLHGLTMVGLNRLDDLQACVESVVRDGVEGDLIEAGAWRGGASILMRATLDSLGADERTVHVADSFQGFPAADELGDLNEIDFLAVPERGGARQLRALRPRARRAPRPRVLRADAARARPARAGRSCASTATPTRPRARRSRRSTRGSPSAAT